MKYNTNIYVISEESRGRVGGSADPLFDAEILGSTGSPIITQQTGLLGRVTELQEEVICPKMFLLSVESQSLVPPPFKHFWIRSWLCQKGKNHNHMYNL